MKKKIKVTEEKFKVSDLIYNGYEFRVANQQLVDAQGYSNKVRIKWKKVKI